jgi:hypothetical protein
MERAAADYSAHVDRLETHCESLKKRKLEQDTEHRNYVRKLNQNFTSTQRRGECIRFEAMPSGTTLTVVANTIICQCIGDAEETDDPATVMVRCSWKSMSTPPLPFVYGYSVSKFKDKDDDKDEKRLQTTMSFSKMDDVHECTFCVPKDFVFKGAGQFVKYTNISGLRVPQPSRN